MHILNAPLKKIEIDIYMIYVLCPANLVTGGPDALHQIVYYFRTLHIDAKIAYCTPKKADISVPKPYQNYFKDFVFLEDVPDDEKTLVIFPETHLAYLRKFKRIKYAVWWLSVDYGIQYTFFYKFESLLKYPLRYIFRHRKHKGKVKQELFFLLFSKKYSFKKEQTNLLFHLCASYYALDYVSSRSKKPVYKCIEPVSKEFLLKNAGYQPDLKNRKNIVLYNPVKSGKFVEKIHKQCQDLTFVPLRGMTQDQLIQKYREAKVYIDFGPFPGAERMPKEAVLNGCAILTGRRGASNYHGDVPIPEEYKIEGKSENIPLIIEKIRYMLSHYEEIYPLFDEYRETVMKLEENFINSLKYIFSEYKER